MNGTARIEDYPELGRALKQCAKLRAAFIDYFTDGVFIGLECKYENISFVSKYLFLLLFV
jgi:hypothetical protein